MTATTTDLENRIDIAVPRTMYGVSVIICCHNSATRIADTLSCLQAQERCGQLDWEVIVVDNNCTDQTSDVATLQWSRNPVAPLRIVSEPNLGLTYARLKGIAEARFEIICFVDDDNRVDHNWVCQLPQLFEQSPEMAALGGLIVAEFESTAPSWFNDFQAYYAVGPQAKSKGPLDETQGYLCGAGFTVRKSVLNCLFAQGFRFELVGRQGSNLLCSEDLELCLALKLAGWELFYQPSLRMRHYMPDTRMSWSYLRRVARGVGISSSGLIPYYVTLGKGRRDPQMEWLRSTIKAMIWVVLFSFKKLRCLGTSGVGRKDDLEFERVLGLLYGMISRRRQFVRSIVRLRNTSWASCSPHAERRLEQPYAAQSSTSDCDQQTHRHQSA